MRTLDFETALPAVVRVADAERVTGVARATLRIWERRYGFPQPVRDARGERCYDAPQLRKLQLLGVLVGRGHRPGRLIALESAALEALLKEKSTAAAAGEADPLLDILRSSDPQAVNAFLQEQLAAEGLRTFALRTAPALLGRVGEAWGRGALQIHEEHFFSEAMQRALRTAIAGLPPMEGATRPRVLLATLEGEHHGLALLLLEAVLRLEGCLCLPLGINLPGAQAAAAASAMRADVVAVSFSVAFNPRSVPADLRALRALLDAGVELWAGGANSGLARDVPGVQRFAALDAVPQAVAAWRRAAPRRR
jgi:MerR family transcriptional regulator, light-induced transcriptional regulator